MFCAGLRRNKNSSTNKSFSYIDKIIIKAYLT